MTDAVSRFILESCDIRGALVQLGPSWQAIQADRDYPLPVAQLLGEMCAISAIIAVSLKQAGRLTFQLSGTGPVSLLVIDCSESLNLRGYARHANQIKAEAPFESLLTDAQLLMSLDIEGTPQPYQSYIPIERNGIAAVFEDYLALSEQQPATLVLAANKQRAAGLFIQKLPGADLKDTDGWRRIQLLTRTAKPLELLETAPISLLQMLYAEEDIRLFENSPVKHDFPANRAKIEQMLLSLGREEVGKIAAEHGEIVVNDDLSNHRYHFTVEEALAIFPTPESPTDRPT